MKRPIVNNYERWLIINFPDSLGAETARLKYEVLKLRKIISDSIPKSIMAIANFTYKYRVATYLFYFLSIFMIYKEEHLSAIISVAIGLYLALKR